MMNKRTMTALPGLLAAALLAVGCMDSSGPNKRGSGGPDFWVIEPPPPPARHLEFTPGPGNSQPCAVANMAVVRVTVKFADGSTDLTFGSDPGDVVTLTIGNNAGFLADGTLNGNTGQRAVAGVATFGDLCIDEPGPGPNGAGCVVDLVDVCTLAGRSTTGYTLKASAPGLSTIESGAFSISLLI